MLKLKNNKSKGFTIIEVLIVLAIAALILLIVFLAVPQLNNNFHDYQKKQDAAKLKVILLQYYADHQSDAWPFPGGYTNGSYCIAGPYYYPDPIVSASYSIQNFNFPSATSNGGYDCSIPGTAVRDWFLNNMIPQMSYYKNPDYFIYQSGNSTSAINTVAPIKTNCSGTTVLASSLRNPDGTYTFPILDCKIELNRIEIDTSDICINNNSYKVVDFSSSQPSAMITYKLSSGKAQCINIF
ncbi:MAG: prepilin-type N-terminal cleavage/methylation domain-containing protein [Candidatus Saccharibacteria bacterium]